MHVLFDRERFFQKISRHFVAMSLDFFKLGTSATLRDDSKIAVANKDDGDFDCEESRRQRCPRISPCCSIEGSSRSGGDSSHDCRSFPQVLKPWPKILKK